MSNWCSFNWKSGGLTSAPIQDGWAIDLDSRDPSIPNLPLETPALAAVEIAALQPGSARRRHDVPRSLIRQAAAANFDAAVVQAVEVFGSVEGFRTNWIRGRGLVKPEPLVVHQVAVAAFPIAALHVTQVRRRRETTNRRLAETDQIPQVLVSPLIAALPPPRALLVVFERRILPAAQIVLPPPATGPPVVVFEDLHQRRRVPPRRRLAQVLPVIFAAVTLSQPPAFVAPSVNRRKALGRRPAAAPTVVFTPGPVLVPARALRLREGHRRLIAAPLLAHHTATPPATFPVVALPLPRARRVEGLGRAAIRAPRIVFTPAQQQPTFAAPGAIGRRTVGRRRVVGPGIVFQAFLAPVAVFVAPQVRRVTGLLRKVARQPAWVDVPVAVAVPGDDVSPKFIATAPANRFVAAEPANRFIAAAPAIRFTAVAASGFGASS